MEPEGVAPSPNRIKSPVPVCCGFGSINWWAREDLHLQGSQTLDLWGLLFPLNHSPKMVFPAGLSPATSTFARLRSGELSYGNMVLLAGLPPATSAFGGLHSGN